MCKNFTIILLIATLTHVGYGQSTDTPEIIAPSSLVVPEGLSISFDVRLSKQPTADVTVSIPTNIGYLTSNPTTLTFTDENWNTDGTVILNAHIDDNSYNQVVTLLLTASGGGYDRVTTEIQVTIEDDDSPPRITLILSPNRISENQGLTTITATLNQASSEETTVTISADPISPARASDYTLSINTTLTIPAGQINSTGEVTITSINDDTFGPPEKEVIISAISSSNAEDPDNVTLIIEDDDEEPTVTLELSAYRISEDDESTTVTASLNQSSTEVTEITITADPVSPATANDFTLSSNVTLTIPVGQTSSTGLVTITAIDNDIHGPDRKEITVSGISSSNAEDPDDVTLIIEDDDAVFVGLIVPTSVLINEGDTESFDVRLAQQPKDAVTVVITGMTGTDLVLQSPSVLNFSVSDWDQPQLVELMAEDDSDADPDPPVQLILSASGGGYDGVIETVTVTIQENDQVGMVVEPTSLRIDEGESDVLSVYLTAQPSANVTVDISGYATSDLKIPSPSLTFTPTDWQNPKEFTLEAGTDSDTIDDDITLTIRATGGGYSGQQEEVQVTIVDQGLPKITIYDAQAKEDDGIIRLPVELSHTTDQVVTVQYASTDETATAGEDYVSCRGIVIFASGVTREIIQFEILPDALVEDTETFKVTLTNSTHSEIVRPSATATIIDNDGTATKRKSNPDHVSYNQNTCAGLDAFPSDLTVPEGSSNEVYIKLYGAPPSEVIISTSDHKDLLIEPKTLIFTAQNWDRLQAMTLTAAEDIDAINDTFIVNLYASGEMYNDVQSEVFVIISDDDSTGIVLKSNTITVTEGSFTHFELRLTSEPSSDVMVNMDARGDLTLDPTDLTFTATNWANLQSVMVKANEDNDIDNDIETLLLTASGGDYDQVTHEVIVTVEDNDVAGIAISPNTLTVPEGSAQEFIVQLNTAPSGNVLLTIPDGENMVPSPKVVAFTAQNWNEAQSINIVASEDENQENDQEILILTGAGAEYAGITQQLSITIVDNDLSRINLNPDLPQTAEEPTTGTIYDGESTELQIVLAQKPIANVTVEISSSNTSVKTSPSTLTFTSSNWEMEQTIIITSQENNQTISDERVVDDHLKHGGSFHFNREVVLTLIASGGGYDGVSQQRQFTIIDQSNVNIQLSETPPVSVQLWGNYPNPFSTMTNIAFDLPAPAQISLIVTDLLGRTVMYIPDQWYGLGQHQTLQIQSGELPSGVYYYRLEVNIDGKITGHTKPMLIIR